MSGHIPHHEVSDMQTTVLKSVWITQYNYLDAVKSNFPLHCEECQEVVIVLIWSIPTVVGKRVVCFSWLWVLFICLPDSLLLSTAMFLLCQFSPSLGLVVTKALFFFTYFKSSEIFSLMEECTDFVCEWRMSNTQERPHVGWDLSCRV